MTNDQLAKACKVLRSFNGAYDEYADEIERLEGIQRDFHNLDDLAAIKQLHAAVDTAQKLAATRLMEIETLRSLLGEVYNHGENSELHRRIQQALGCGDTYTPEPLPSQGVKCIHCNGKGVTDQIYDEQRGGWSAPNIPCQTCGGSGRIRTVEQYLKTLPANWHVDSSLETWFPITAEELERLRSVASHACVAPPEKRYCTCFFMGKDDVRPDHSPDCMLNDGNKLNALKSGGS